MQPETRSKETRLYNIMDNTLGHIFALALGIGPGFQIYSGCEAFAGLFCIELYTRLKMKSIESRIAILQRNWKWIQETVRKVTLAHVYALYVWCLNFMVTRHINNQRRNQKQQLTKVFW